VGFCIAFIDCYSRDRATSDADAFACRLNVPMKIVDVDD
jgi:hypothetical protein